MAATARNLAAHGLGSAAPWVFRDNAPARRFYEAVGGALLAEREDRGREDMPPDVAYGWWDIATLLAA